MPRTGPKPLITLGMLLAGAGLAWLTRIGVNSGYAADVLPPLIVARLGLGLVIAPSVNTGTYGVARSDAGVASATVNTGQQLGGSLGTALLNTMAASATTAYLTAHVSPATLVGGRPSPQLLGQAVMHGYTTAFWWAAGIFAAGAVASAVLMRGGPLTPAHGASAGAARPVTPGRVAAG